MVNKRRGRRGASAGVTRLDKLEGTAISVLLIRRRRRGRRREAYRALRDVSPRTQPSVRIFRVGANRGQRER
jgi:hypothetical protein